jgi:photosystem II stability/assembly factor-like uncharacterized protein
LILGKFYILFIFICITQNAECQQYWLRQQSPTNAWLHKCCFADSLTVWAAGDSGIVLKTTNGGFSWQRQNTGISFPIEDIMFINANMGWAVANNFIGMGALILSTTNGGSSWQNYTYPDSTAVFSGVYFLDPLNGWISGYDGLFLNTTNGGASWIRKPTDSSFASNLPVKSICMYNNRIGYASGGFRDLAGVIWRTTNFGNLWEGHVAGGEPLYGLLVIDSLNIIAVGGDLEFGASIVKTTNGGINWSYQLLNIFGTGYAIAFRTPEEGWTALGYSQEFIHSTDSGVTWNTTAIFDSSAVYDVIFTDPYHGYAVGTNGLILKYNTNTIGIEPEEQLFPASFSLKQNFPNPFNGQTTIEFDLPRKTKVTIRIFDISGRQVKILQNAILSAGQHRLRMNSDEFASGVYFYRIETPEFTESKKMVLIK